MEWIKRNLIFVIGAAVALVLMGLDGWYNYAGWQRNTGELEKLNAGYEELKRLSSQNPHPGDGKKVDNIKLAQEQEQEAAAFGRKLERHLQRVPALPEGPNVVGKDFSFALQQTIVELQRDATNQSVILPPKYKFSFEAQAGRVTFAAGSLDRLAEQLGEVREISRLLQAAKVNYFDAIRRERVSADDMSGPATDYLDRTSVTNEQAILTPYEVSFRCFTPESAAVLTGFANTTYGLIVKGMNVESAPMQAAEHAPVYQPAYIPPAPSAVRRMGRELEDELESGTRYGGMRPTTVMPATTATPVRSGPQTFLSEKQLKVTMLIHVVKPLAQK